MKLQVATLVTIRLVLVSAASLGREQQNGGSFGNRSVRHNIQIYGNGRT